MDRAKDLIRACALAVVLTLCACGPTPVEKARERVDFLEKNHASEAELCQAYSQLADAYRDANDSQDWQWAKTMERNICLVEALHERGL